MGTVRVICLSCTSVVCQLCIRREVYLNEPVPQPAHARYLETDNRDSISLQPEEKAMVLAVRLLDGLGLKRYGSDRTPL